MIKDKSNEIALNNCKYCGNKIKEEQVEQIFLEKESVCELCGAKLKKKHFEMVQDSNIELPLRRLARQMRIFTYRRIYEILYTPEFTKNLMRGQKELKKSQCECLANNLRKSLIDQPISNDWLNDAIVNPEDFFEYYNEYVKNVLSDNKYYKAEYFETFQIFFQDIFGLMSGKLKISNFRENNQVEIIEILKKYYGFPSNYNQGTFEYYFTLISTKYFYFKIKMAKITKVPNKQYTEKLVSSLIAEIYDDIKKGKILHIFPKKIGKFIKREFKRLRELSWNQIYRESFLDYCQWLIKTILELSNMKNNLSDLLGIKREIVESLVSTEIFKEDERFSVNFKGILVIVISRIIFRNLNSLTVLTETLKNKIAYYLMSEISNKERLNREYLENLNQNQIKNFDNIYQKFRLELISDKIYAESFKKYLHWFIEIIQQIGIGGHSVSNLSHFGRILTDELKKLDQLTLGEDNLPEEESEQQGYFEEEKEIIFKNFIIGGSETQEDLEELINKEEEKILTDPLNEFIPEVICHILIDEIKEKIKINNDDFDKYVLFAKNNNINVDLILQNLFEKSKISKLLQQAKIKNNASTFTQAERCVQIISLALLKCNNYDELFKELSKLTKLTHATIWSQIKKYIPILKILNPGIDIKKLLPRSKEISYGLLKKKVENLSQAMTGTVGTLIKPKDEREWLIMAKNKHRKSQIPIVVKCNRCEDKLNSRYNYINRGRWNCDCTKTLYESELTYDFNRLKKEIEELGKDLTGVKGTLLRPQNEDEYNKLRIEQNKSPTQLKIKVRCNKCGKIWETMVTSLIHHGNWCGRCTDSRVYSYEDIIELMKSVTLNVIGVEGILMRPKNQEDFKKLSNVYIPSQVPLVIKCGNCGNELNYITQYLKAGFFPCTCINLKYETILSWYFYKMIGVRFNHTSLSSIIPAYTGKLEYDGYIELLVDENYINIGGSKVFLEPYYVIYKSNNPLITEISISRTFKYRPNEINTFIEDFENDIFKERDIISVDLSYGYLDFIFKNNKIRLLNSQLYDSKYFLTIKDIFKIAFEFNGRQHYEFPNAFHKKIEEFLEQVINDLLKKKLSIENNIFLIIFPYWINLKMDNPIKIQGYINETFHSKLSIDLSFLPQYDHNNPDFGQYRLDHFEF